MVRMTGAVFPLTVIAKAAEELKEKIRKSEGNDDLESTIKYFEDQKEKESEENMKKILAKITGKKEVDDDVFNLTEDGKKLIKTWTENRSEKLEVGSEIEKLTEEIMKGTPQYMEKKRRKELLKDLIEELNEEE